MIILLYTGLQRSVIVGPQPYGLGLNETIMPQYLKDLGYATHAVGKVFTLLSTCWCCLYIHWYI